MGFFAENGGRPIRLTEDTRKFAFESLNRKYGLEAIKTPNVSLNHVDGYESMSALQKYNFAIKEIVTKAPVRICEKELISGAATLGDAIKHVLPALYQNEERSYFSGTSHLTVDFETVLKKGIGYIENTAEAALLKYNGTEKEEFVLSCLHCINCMKIWHKRYLDSLKEMPAYSNNYNNLLNVPFNPARNFYEAVQSIWFTFAFLRLCGNWPGIGRIDWLLGDYLEKDLSDGVLTVEEAREILAHFFIKGCEWIGGCDCNSGDAQHYQNILLGGIDENGKDVTNTVTYLVLDILEELNISDFPTTVRINKNTSPELLKRVAEVIRYGGGVLAIYNEDLIIESLVDYGYELKEARKFANDGCWEVQIPGKTFFSYIPFDSLQVLQGKTLKNYSEDVTFESFNELYAKFKNDLSEKIQKIVAERNREKFINIDTPLNTWQWKHDFPCTLVSLFERGCIEKGLSYNEGGPVYNVVSPHIGGLPDVANSLYAIKKLVFDDKKISFSKLMTALKNNWENDEDLRIYALNKYSYYGNDNSEVDEIAKKVVEDFADICDCVNETTVYKTPAGISTFGRQLEWSPYRFATPYGKKAHDILAGNFSPTPGTDKEGATAVIKSYCKANLKRTVSGAALDVKLMPSSVEDEKGVEIIISLIKSFVTLGGHFMQLDIADTELLKQAQKNPENYKNLCVRVSGWSARFVTMNKEWQDMIIDQRSIEN